jgi:hypothetical protein
MLGDRGDHHVIAAQLQPAGQLIDRLGRVAADDRLIARACPVPSEGQRGQARRRRPGRTPGTCSRLRGRRPSWVSRSRSASCSTRSSCGCCWSPPSTWTSAGTCGGPARWPAPPTRHQKSSAASPPPWWQADPAATTRRRPGGPAEQGPSRRATGPVTRCVSHGPFSEISKKLILNEPWCYALISRRKARQDNKVDLAAAGLVPDLLCGGPAIQPGLSPALVTSTVRLCPAGGRGERPGAHRGVRSGATSNSYAVSEIAVTLEAGAHHSSTPAPDTGFTSNSSPHRPQSMRWTAGSARA